MKVNSFNYDDFRARLKNAYRSIGLSWPQFCELAGIRPGAALYAVEGCERGLQPHIPVLEKLASAMGRDLQWLLTGESVDQKFRISLRESTHSLVDEFIYRAQVPEEDQHRLHRYTDSMIDSLQAQTQGAAFRRGLPVTWRDVGWIYEELLQSQG